MPENIIKTDLEYKMIFGKDGLGQGRASMANKKLILIIILIAIVVVYLIGMLISCVVK